MLSERMNVKCRMKTYSMEGGVPMHNLLFQDLLRTLQWISQKRREKSIHQRMGHPTALLYLVLGTCRPSIVMQGPGRLNENEFPRQLYHSRSSRKKSRKEIALSSINIPSRRLWICCWSLRTMEEGSISVRRNYV